MYYRKDIAAELKTCFETAAEDWECENNETKHAFMEYAHRIMLQWYNMGDVLCSGEMCYLTHARYCVLQLHTFIAGPDMHIMDVFWVSLNLCDTSQ